MGGESWNPDDAWDDDEGPQECDLTDDEDEYDVEPCPSCGRDISELSEQCPYCGEWIERGGGSPTRRGPLVVALAILLLISFLIWVF